MSGTNQEKNPQNSQLLKAFNNQTKIVNRYFKNQNEQILQINSNLLKTNESIQNIHSDLKDEIIQVKLDLQMKKVTCGSTIEKFKKQEDVINFFYRINKNKKLVLTLTTIGIIIIVITIELSIKYNFILKLFDFIKFIV